MNATIQTAQSSTAPNGPPARITHALTVDVEDYFQVSAFEHRVSRSSWENRECRVEANTDKLLALFDRCDVRGTFFILGWVASHYPQLVQRIAAAGHEIASHGYWHRLVYDLTPEQFADDIQKSKAAIFDACQIEPTAYRAPSFSIVERSLWALDILSEQGFTTDSSIFPIRGHDRYGMPNAKQEIHTLPTASDRIQEFPPTLETVAGIKVPIGGGYFRLLPASVTSAAIRKIEAQNRPAMFYIHPWEVDPQQPRITGVGSKNRFRHYVGLKRTEAKLEKLISSHRFGTMTAAMQSAEACRAPI
ncbi:XrtA system polysaccharide deacetylase [Roseimaritima ulvae]|uniref:Peptidoglycan deacetylase n=1 Tax=Roseimaritima ulvae TaxID=980254 RepID=A0A5B9R7M7_9BACT|nr:XrtA system polysaccharide deacetylase [Roseimaritima ulvae]QEG42473.1 Peptidoglycan deacetylase [Roseimaritima ulvae]